MTKTIFVFGSNLAGRHGKGAAKYAKDLCGAEYGVGIGRTGDAYAIPTKDENLKTLPFNKIMLYYDDFIGYAKQNPNLLFIVTPFGTGLAGYSFFMWKELISSRIKNTPNNVVFHKECFKDD